MRLSKKKALQKILLRCCVFIIVLLTTACSAEPMLVVDAPFIIVNKGKYSDYYHINYTLTPDNTRLNIDDAKPNMFENENGQFEIYINKNQFPIAAPMCKDTIILRMPGTNPFGGQAQQSIDEKKIVFESIQSMINAHFGAVEVVVELNPYVKKVQNTPLTLQLTQCNIFFRHAKNRYVNYLGKLKKTTILKK